MEIYFDLWRKSYDAILITFFLPTPLIHSQSFSILPVHSTTSTTLSFYIPTSNSKAMTFHLALHFLNSGRYDPTLIGSACFYSQLFLIYYVGDDGCRIYDRHMTGFPTSLLQWADSCTIQHFSTTFLLECIDIWLLNITWMHRWLPYQFHSRDLPIILGISYDRLLNISP